MDLLNRVQRKPGGTGPSGVVLDFAKTRKKAEGAATGSAIKDRVDISPGAQVVGRAKAAVEQAAEVRVTRVEALRALVRGQEYPVDARKVADKLVEEHLSELV